MPRVIKRSAAQRAIDVAKAARANDITWRVVSRTRDGRAVQGLFVDVHLARAEARSLQRATGIASWVERVA
jgi:hypothetical protein